MFKRTAFVIATAVTAVGGHPVHAQLLNTTEHCSATSSVPCGTPAVSHRVVLSPRVPLRACLLSTRIVAVASVPVSPYRMYSSHAESGGCREVCGPRVPSRPAMVARGIPACGCTAPVVSPVVTVPSQPPVFSRTVVTPCPMVSPCASNVAASCIARENCRLSTAGGSRRAVSRGSSEKLDRLSDRIDELDARLAKLEKTLGSPVRVIGPPRHDLDRRRPPQSRRSTSGSDGRSGRKPRSNDSRRQPAGSR